MEQERFDHLARGWASGITRRGLVRQLSGAAIGGVLAAVGAGEAGARKKKHRGKRRKPRPSQCTTCSDTCPGAAETNPAKTVSFTPTGSPDYCGVVVDLSGFAGCTEHTAEYWSALNLSGFRAKNNGNVTLGPTDLSGSSRTDLGTFIKGGAVDIRFAGDAANYQYVDC